MTKKNVAEVIPFGSIKRLVDIEVGKKYPLPFPEQGVRMDLFDGLLVVSMSIPDITPGDITAFKQGFESFSYLESNTSVPLCMWSFPFNAPMNTIEVNFNAKQIDEKIIETFLNDDVVRERGLHFCLISNGELIAMNRADLTDEAWNAFEETVRKQLAAKYEQNDYLQCLHSLYHFSPEEIEAMGTKYCI